MGSRSRRKADASPLLPAIEALREAYHREVCCRVIFTKGNDVPSMADTSNAVSVGLSQGILRRLPYATCPEDIKPQTAGQQLEEITRTFLRDSFALLQHLRPGSWVFSVQDDIAAFDQYAHLAELSRLVEQHEELRTALGDYVIKPDIVVGRLPVSDEDINVRQQVVTEGGPPTHSPLRASNSALPTLHASISCKWTIRSDRSQNARTEGLNLVRNRKGRTPHIVVVTGEPFPNRLASLAMGTGDIDCIYHFALPELAEAVTELGNETASEMLDLLVCGRRLRDISDLPFDLAI